MSAVYLIGTLDTKGTELAFVQKRMEAYGVDTKLVDAGSGGPAKVVADVPRERVFAAAGADLAALQAGGDRGTAVAAAARGAAELIRAEYEAGLVAGVLALGGSAGTTIGTAAMRALPLGVPKLMVSTLASGQVRPFVGNKDILMLNSVVDISGINRISRPILENAARAMAGMVAFARDATLVGTPDKPVIAASMFGVTTPCVEEARKVLEAAGYEVLVFHATGNGGLALESLVADGMVAGVLDITTTELADELVGGELTAGPDRLTAAGRRGVPQVISVGALDMVNFGPFETVPAKFADRKFHKHNANVTLMRTTPAENRRLGEEIGRKAAAAQGPCAIVLPLRGVSAIDREGQSFDDPAARAVLFAGIRATHGGADLLELDQHINDADFATTAARKLLELIRRGGRG